MYKKAFSLLLIKAKRTSKVKVKRWADTGSPWRTPFSKLNYVLVLPALIAQDCWLLGDNLIQLVELLPKPSLFNTITRKSWPNESEGFSISMVTKYPPIFCFFANFSNLRDQLSTFANALLVDISSSIWRNYCRKSLFSFAVRAFYIMYLSTLVVILVSNF